MSWAAKISWIKVSIQLKFPFWYQFSFFRHVSFAEKHSSWNEIKGFIYLFLAIHTHLASCIMQIRQCHCTRNHFSVSDHFNYFRIQRDQKLVESVRKLGCPTVKFKMFAVLKQNNFSVFNYFNDWNKCCCLSFMTLFPESLENCQGANWTVIKHPCRVYLFDLIAVFHSWCRANSWHLLNIYGTSQLISVRHWLIAFIAQTFTAYCKNQIYSISLFLCIMECLKKWHPHFLDASPTTVSALVQRAN